MVKTLKDYLLDGWVRGRSFRASDDDYLVEDIKYDAADKDTYLHVRFRGGSKGLFSFRDLARRGFDHPETSY